LGGWELDPPGDGDDATEGGGERMGGVEFGVGVGHPPKLRCISECRVRDEVQAVIFLDLNTGTRRGWKPTNGDGFNPLPGGAGDERGGLFREA